MQHTHRFEVAAPVQTVFDAFSHLEQLAPCFPGATLSREGDDRLLGTLAVKVGSVPLHFMGTGSYLERNASRHRVRVRVQGQDDRGLGGAAALVTTQLTGRGAVTEVTVHLELDLTGTPSRYGTAVADDVLAKLFDQFGAGVAARLADSGAQSPVARSPLRRFGPPAAALAALAALIGFGLPLVRRRAGVR